MGVRYGCLGVCVHVYGARQESWGFPESRWWDPPLELPRRLTDPPRPVLQVPVWPGHSWPGGARPPAAVWFS